MSSPQENESNIVFFSLRRAILIRFIAVTVLVGACTAIYSCYRIMRADYFFRLDTPESLKRAIAISPNDAKLYVRLVQLDRDNARSLLEKARALSPYDSSVLIQLGLLRESTGDIPEAEDLPKQATVVDTSYKPLWALANFYVRQGQTDQFWRVAQRAAALKPQDPAGLFRLCWRVAPNPEVVRHFAVPDDAHMVRSWTEFLVAGKQLKAADAAGERLIQLGSATDDSVILSELTDRLISAGHFDEAQRLWRHMAKRGWIPEYSSTVYNPSFQTTFLQHGFDWTTSGLEGISSTLAPGGGLEIRFSGREPEDCLLLQQVVALRPGKYKLTYKFKTDDLAPDTGLHWSIRDPFHFALIATSSNLPSQQSANALLFEVAENTYGILLRLEYQRVVGTTRLSGAIMLQNVQVVGL